MLTKVNNHIIKTKQQTLRVYKHYLTYTESNTYWKSIQNNKEQIPEIGNNQSLYL